MTALRRAPGADRLGGGGGAAAACLESFVGGDEGDGVLWAQGTEFLDAAHPSYPTAHNHVVNHGVSAKWVQGDHPQLIS